MRLVFPESLQDLLHLGALRVRKGRQFKGDVRRVLAQDREFFTAVGTSDQLDRYRKDAQDILLAYANQMVVQARSQIEREAVEGRIDAAAKKIEQSGSFWASIKAGVVSTLINTAVLILLAVGIRLIGIDLLSAYTSIGGTASQEQGGGE